MDNSQIEMINKNELLNRFSAPMGNNKIKFLEYAQTIHLENSHAIIDEFISMQDQVFDQILRITEPNIRLTGQEIEKACSDFCLEKFDWLNTKGISAISRWLIWMCWHEGILKATE